MKRLTCMATHCDGAHCGLSDWYPEIEEGIQKALNQGTKHTWTTGWYASKKEIASACITHANGEILVEVNVSDDLDTEGRGEERIPHTTDLEMLRTAIAQAWDQADSNQKDNQVYAGFAILRDGHWVETYLAPVGDGHQMEQPPGDNYHQWGFQGEAKVPERIKKRLASWAGRYLREATSRKSFTFEGWKIRPWED